MNARLAALLLVAAAGAAAAEPPLGADEVARLLQHGPWPPALQRDPSNRVSGSAAAARFGRALFFDTRLSPVGTLSCASCHRPELAWSDGLPRPAGDAARRNTPSLLDVRFNRWFGWSGASDSLWAASLRPLTEPDEMGRNGQHAAARVRADARLARGYQAAFGRTPPPQDDVLLADLGKALAAFQETLVSGRSPFDDFRDALERGDRAAAARYPAAALRGARLFVGRAGCNVCHIGPLFSNGEFDKVGIAVRDARGRFDWGRYEGIKAVLASRFNRLSRHSDDAGDASTLATRHVRLDPEMLGAFKVPGLRNVALTAPYMHDGSLATLRDVVRHYSTIDEMKLAFAVPTPHPEPQDTGAPPPRGSALRTLQLSDEEIDDLVAFLESLTGHARPEATPAASAEDPC